MATQKRKVQFQEPNESEPSVRKFKEEHLVDSDIDDDDDDEEPLPCHANVDDNILNEDDIEGQEEETIRFDGDIAVTPFNLREEMEEGHFDVEGNYVANKDKGEIHDGWLDSVDWNKVPEEKRVQTLDNSDDDEGIPKLDTKSSLVEILKLLQPGENVLKALRRLGGRKQPASSADRWKKKKQAIPAGDEEQVDEQERANKESLLRLTELADLCLQNGDFQIYDKTFEQITYEVKRKSEQFEDADDVEDKELEAAFNETGQAVHGNAGQTRESAGLSDKQVEDYDNPSAEIQWVYKLANSDDSDLLGPFSNTQMMTWQAEGKFEDGVFCRKVDSTGPFYNSLRVDFELYA